MIATLSSLAQPLPIDAEPLARPDVAWIALGPVLVLIGGALLLMLVSSLAPRKPLPGSYALFTVIVAGGSMAVAIPLWDRVVDEGRGPFSTLADSVGVDGFSVFFTFVIGASVVLAALINDGFLRREGDDGAESYVLMLLSASGGLIMASANDLIVMFLGLEILSIAVYVLAAMQLRRVTSQEAGVKYFVLGAFSSAFFLYGVALIYGGTGSTNLVRIVDFFAANALLDSGLVLAGLALLLVGFGFKVAAVPFHFWTPDVYQGAPSPAVAYMASGVKAAGFAGLLRVFFLAFDGYRLDWQPLIYGLAVATLLVGSILAVVQRDVKRMLAYSSISHAGFILVGVQAASDQGVAGSLFYLAAYVFMIAGSFGVISLIGREGDIGHDVDDYRGLSKSRPALALAFAIFLFAQTGVPLTSGFFAKFYVITAAVDAHSYWLAVVAMVSAVIAAYLYLRIIVSMYMTSDDEEEGSGAADRVIPIPTGVAIALVIALIVTIGAGVWPGAISHFADKAIPALVASG